MKYSRVRKRKLCLTYDNKSLCDGLGAQLQRIAFIYGFTKKNNYSFTNSLIISIDSNPGDGITSLAEKQNLINEANSIFVIPLGSCDHEYHNIINPKFKYLVRRFGMYRTFIFLNQIIRFYKKNKQIRFNNQLIYKKTNPAVYEIYANYIKKNKKFIEWLSDLSSYEIQIQLSAAVVSKEKTPERYIDHEQIKQVLETIRISFPNWKVMLHTDVDQRNSGWKLTGLQDKETIKYWKHIGVLDGNNQVSLNFPNLHEIFPPNLVDKFESKISPLEVWKNMAKSKILVCGKSSLSFIGGLLIQDPKALVIAPYGYIKYPKNWLQINYDENTGKINLNSFKKWKKFVDNQSI